MVELRKADFNLSLKNPDLWQDVKGYEGIYKISKLGFVYSIKSGKILSPGLGRNGYLTVSLYSESVHISRYLHRLVAEHFIPNPEGKKCVNHTHGYKLNNHKSGLEWATHSENNIHALQTGLRRKGQEAKGLIQMDKEGNVVRTYRTTVEAEAYGFSSGNIALCCAGKRSHHKGFKWQYINN
jgi:hypothetical protein